MKPVGGRAPDRFTRNARLIREGRCQECGGELIPAVVTKPWGEPPAPMPKTMLDGEGWPCLGCETCGLAFRLAMRPSEVREGSGRRTPAIVCYPEGSWAKASDRLTSNIETDTIVV